MVPRTHNESIHALPGETPTPPPSATTTTVTVTNSGGDNSNDAVDDIQLLQVEEERNADNDDDDNDGDIELQQPPRRDNSSSVIPLVEVSIENLSYAPMVRTAAPTTAATNSGTTGTRSRKKPFKMTSPATHQQQQRKMILSNITTTIEPYKLTAWMGPSGSGKTSLLSVVAGLVPTTDIMVGSCMRVNQEIGAIPKRYIGVVWQDDLLLSNLTVEENLYIAARLKTSDAIGNESVRTIVYETMQELNLLHVRNSLVGDPLNTSSTTSTRGISGGERKRVAVGMELVVRPSILLLDEITSGLDSTTALQLMITLQQLAHTKGHTIVVVIHQPRTTIYNTFDHLLLLSRGQMIYNGPPNQVRSYFETNYGALPPETGIADWMMDIVTTVERKHDNEHNELVQHWINYRDTVMTAGTNGAVGQSFSVDDNNNNNNRPQEKHDQPTMRSLKELRTGPKFNTSFSTQLRILLYRVMKQQRGERITRSAILLQVLYAFFTALFWWRIPDTTARIYERNSLLFFILIAQANSIVITAVTVFQRERVLLSRERAKKMYTVSSYFIAKTLSDVSNNVILPLLYSMVVYWTGGFRASFVAYIKYVVAFYWIFSTAQSMGLFISITIPNRNLSLLFAPPITLFFAILGGFYIPLDNLHPGVQWATYLSFARYGYSALIINEYEGRTVPCSDDVAIGIPVQECPLPGEVVVSSFGIHGINQNFWFNIMMMILLQIVFRVGAYGALRRSK